MILNLFARSSLSMPPRTLVWCRTLDLLLTHSLKAAQKPEYSHIVDAAVKYAKVVIVYSYNN